MPEHEDPFERRLRALADEAARSASGLPVAEVRARGSRRRQRRVAVVAGLAAAAVVAAGTVAVGVRNTAQVAPATPGPVPPGGWVQEIPDDFVIDADPPPDDAGAMTRGPAEDLGVVDATICGEQALDGSPEPVDQLGFRTALQWRGLTVYADDAAAQTALDEFVDRAESCPSDSSTDPVGDVSRYSWAVEPTPGGNATDVVVTLTLSRSDRPLTFQLAQVGNALAVVRGASGPAAAAEARLVEQMCVFTVESCAPASTTPPESLTEAVLPAADELAGYNENTGWRTVQTGASSVGLELGPCIGSSVDRGATDVVFRAYDGTISGTPAAGSTEPRKWLPFAAIAVADFRHMQDAQRAYALLKLKVAACARSEQLVDERVRVDEPSPHPAGEEAFTQLVWHGQVPGAPFDWVIDAYGMVVDGDRVAVVSQRHAGQDYIYPPGEEPISVALAAVAERLAASP